MSKPKKRLMQKPEKTRKHLLNLIRLAIVRRTSKLRKRTRKRTPEERERIVWSEGHRRK